MNINHRSHHPVFTFELLIADNWSARPTATVRDGGGSVAAQVLLGKQRAG